MSDTTYLPFYQYDTCGTAAQEVAPDTSLFPLDSVWQALGRGEPTLRTSLFTHHELTVVNSDAIALPQPLFDNWIFVAIIALIALLYLYMSRHELRAKELPLMVFDTRTRERMLRNANLNHNSALAPIGMLYCAPIAMLIYHYTTTEHIVLFDTHGSLTLLLIYLTVCGYYFVRNMLFLIVGAAAHERDSVANYITNNYICHLLATLVTLPIMLLLYYLPLEQQAVGVVATTIVAILFVLRLARGAKVILTTTQTFQLQLFYYLCIFEIVPLLLIYKAFILL